MYKRHMAFLVALMITCGLLSTLAISYVSAASLADAAPVVDASVDAIKDAAQVIKGQPLPAVNSEDPGGIFKFMLQAVKESKWAWFVGLLLMLITWVVNKILKEKIPKKVLPWIAISLGVSMNILMSSALGMSWYEAIGNGVSLGLAAAGGWSVLGKVLLSKKAS